MPNLTGVSTHKFEIYVTDEMQNEEGFEYTLQLVDDTMADMAEMISQRVREVDSRITVEYHEDAP
jgi:hypothetical protein